MKKTYITPSIEIVAFRPLNVIATSGGAPTITPGYSDPSLPNLSRERDSNPIWD